MEQVRKKLNSSYKTIQIHDGVHKWNFGSS